MKSYWTVAVLLSSALLVGCGDRNDDNAQNLDPNAAPTTGLEAADQVNPPAPGTAPQATSPDVDSGRPAASARATTRRQSQPSAGSPTVTNRPGTFDTNRTTREANNRPAAAPRVEWREITIPAGTSVPMELTTALSSETAAIETPVSARIRQAVVIDGVTVIPAGSIASGVVTDVDRAGRVKGRSRLALRFNQVQVNGAREDLRTDPLSFEGEASKGEDATKIGAGAGIGAIIGGIVGGGDGAAKGAAIGGAAGTGAVLATRGKEITLASGTDITATLAAPTTIQIRVQ